MGKFQNALSDAGKRENVIQELFVLYDKNKSGYIEQMELMEAFKDLASRIGNKDEITEEYVHELMREFDCDNDGKLCYEEFREVGEDLLLELAKSEANTVS